MLDDDPRITRVGRFLRRHEPRRAAQLWNVIRGRDEPGRPAAAARGRGRTRRRLAPRPARPDAGDHRSLAGARPDQHPVRGDGQARLPVRDQLVAVDGHAPAAADAARGAAPPRDELIGAVDPCPPIASPATRRAGRRVPGHGHSRRDVAADHRPGADHRPRADPHAAQDRRARSRSSPRARPDSSALPVVGPGELAVGSRWRAAACR